MKKQIFKYFYRKGNIEIKEGIIAKRLKDLELSYYKIERKKYNYYLHFFTDAEVSFHQERK